MIVTRGLQLLCFLVMSTYLMTSPAAEGESEPGYNDANKNSDKTAPAQVVDYPASFFSRYHPNTALDMVEQLPGFRSSDGSGERGYGDSAGNILIDGNRPASKQDSPTEILDRIPAAQVARIELIRGPVRDIELLGETEVVNVVLLDDVPAAIRWEAGIGVNSGSNALPLAASISLADLWRGIEFNTGLQIQRFVRNNPGTHYIYDGSDALTETRDDDEAEKGYEGGATLGASTWLGQTLLQVNSQFSLERSDEWLNSLRVQVDSEDDVRRELFDEHAEEFQYELGLNAQRPLQEQLMGKLILLYNLEDENASESQLSLDNSGNRTGLKLKDGEQIAAEAIARVEIDWSGWSGHLFRLNLESSWNKLANSEIETEDSGDGPEIVDVPGANTSVEEQRWDMQIKDTWTLGAYELDAGIGAEISTITQSGDAELERDFFFLKPHLLVTRASGRDRQLRLRVAREVAQLDFGDFVSASVFEDEELALGNPDLRPETTWVAELGYEQRYGPIGMSGVTLFHHWINDVQDLLPLTASEEVPGNIGDGRRWGIVFEGVLPLDWLGLADARLDIDGRWQDSSVTDPVTGQQRVLSATSDDWEEGIAGGDNEYSLDLGYRQDFEAARVAWGMEVEVSAESPRFKVNELDVSEEGVELDLFVETTRWLGLKVRAELNNLLNTAETRDRLIYTGARSLSAIQRRQFERSLDARQLVLTISGTF